MRTLAEASPEFAAWDAHLLLIAPAPAAEAAVLHPAFGTVLADEHRHVADPASASLLVADGYGQVFHVVDAGSSHRLASRHDLDEWLKFLGTLCPE